MAGQNISRNASHTTSIPSVNYNMLACLLPLALVIVIVNSLVVALFWKRFQLRTPQNYFLLGLALSDLLTGLVNIPLLIILTIVKLTHPRHVADPLAFFVPLCHNFSAVLAAFQILAITTEKLMAIRSPLKHRRLFGKKKARQVLAAIWFISALVAFFPFCFYKKRREDIWKTVQLAYAIFYIVAVFLVPYSFMIYAQYLMFKTISGSLDLPLTTMNKKEKDQHRAQKKVKSDRKCLVVFASMAAIYVICWLPWFVYALLFSLIPFDIVSPDSFGNSVQAIVIIRYLSSIINPLVYTFFKRDFLKAF